MRDIIVLVTVLGMALLMCCSRGRAAEALPLSVSDPSLPCYATVHEAASEALRGAIVVSRQYEAGGAIYRHGPLYCFTAPVTQHDPYAVDYRIGLVAPDVLVGLYHTHPGSRRTGADAEHISDQDTDLSKRTHLPMFILAIEANLLLSYYPK